MPLLKQILTIAYAGVGLISLIAYWPTIRDLLAKKPSANTASYKIWTVTTAISFLYSLFILDDLLFRIVSGIHFFACSIVLLLIYKINK